jgi:hypothetical protein
MGRKTNELNIPSFTRLYLDVYEIYRERESEDLNVKILPHDKQEKALIMFRLYSNVYLDISVKDMVTLVKMIPPITIFIEANVCTEWKLFVDTISFRNTQIFLFLLAQ